MGVISVAVVGHPIKMTDNKNKVGPRIDPCGTPHISEAEDKTKLPMDILSVSLLPMLPLYVLHLHTQISIVQNHVCIFLKDICMHL